MPTVRARVDRSSVLAALRDYCEDRLEDLGDEFVERARARTSRRTGELHDSIEAEPPRMEAERGRVLVAARAEHARWQDEGTGVFGPSGQPIRAADYGHRAFRFHSHVTGETFAAVVQGSEPTRFWTLTVEEWPEIVRSV